MVRTFPAPLLFLLSSRARSGRLHPAHAAHVARLGCRYVPTGFQSKELIVKAGLNLGDVDQFPNIDVTIDGADEVDVSPCTGLRTEQVYLHASNKRSGYACSYPHVIRPVPAPQQLIISLPSCRTT